MLDGECSAIKAGFLPLPDRRELLKSGAGGAIAEELATDPMKS